VVRWLERLSAGIWRSPWLAVVLASLAVLPGNGANRPLEEHEAFVARTAEEMDRAGEWLVGRFGGEVRLEKPPVGYWLALAVHRILGGDRVSELQARVPSMLAGVILAYLIFQVAAAVFVDRRVGAVAAVLWATSGGLSIYGRNARPEMVYTLLCTALALGLVCAARVGPRTRAGWAWALFGWMAAALAVLTKGPFLPVLIALGACAGAWVGRRRPGAIALRAVHPLAGAALLIGVSAAYAMAVRAVVPEALVFWRHEMFERVGGDSPAWSRPFELYYLYATLPLLMPWLVPVACAVPWTVKQPGGLPWMLAGAVLTTGFALSFSEGRHAYYMLPVLPLAHCLMGGWTVAWYERVRSAPRSTALGRVLAVHTALLPMLALYLFTVLVAEPPSPRAPILAASILVLVLGVAGLAWRARGARPGTAFLWIAVGLAASYAGFGAYCVGSSADRFTKAAFAREVGRLVPADVPLVALGRGRELLIYYADRPVPRISASDLGNYPEALVVATRSSVDRGDVVGEVLLAERDSEGADPMILLRPGPGEQER
jgi:4-amino-4-deoxy-L-arabinose transferase-like glycosyltransferase